MDAIACACFSSSQPSDGFERLDRLDRLDRLERLDSVSVLDASMFALARHDRLSRQAGLDK
jgi:hypothetical protein